MNAKAKQTLSDVQRLSDVQQVQIRDELLQSHPLTDMTIMTNKGTDIGLKLKRENFEFQICHFQDGSNISLSDNENTVILKLTKDEMLALQEDIELRYPSEPKVKALEWAHLRGGHYSFTMMGKEISICDQDDVENPDITWWACFPSTKVYLEKGFPTLKKAQAWCQEKFEKEVGSLFV